MRPSVYISGQSVLFYNIITITKGAAQGEYIPNTLLIFHLTLFNATLFTKLVANYATKKNI